MFTPDDFQYAIENTSVIVSPSRLIQTFGTTSFRFFLISELMDSVDEIRIREGRVEAERPQILTPERLSHLLLEGFGEKAREFAESIERNPQLATFLKYGFQLSKKDVTETFAHDTLEAVVGRVREQVAASDVSTAVIQGVDEAWEVCLLKFSIDMIVRSAAGNMDDFRKRGLL